nr:MAG TPA: hypothetical protein [Caudoviricetes sp.]
MLEYDSVENVKEDVKNYIAENPPYIEDYADCIKCERINDNGDCEYFFEDLCGLKNELNYKLFIDDGVTGNASGSHTFNSNEAKEYVFAGGSQILKAAVADGYLSSDELVKYFTDENWESLDVVCRCYVLYAAIDEAVDEWAEYYAEENQDYLKQLYEEY